MLVVTGSQCVAELRRFSAEYNGTLLADARLCSKNIGVPLRNSPVCTALIQCALAGPEGSGKHLPGTDVGLVYLAAGRLIAQPQILRCCVYAKALWVVPPSLYPFLTSFSGDMFCEAQGRADLFEYFFLEA